MAYQMIHMEIAYRLLKQLSMVENGAEFILGAVAPDSVHMNQNYEVGMKVSSHMFEFCGKWGGYAAESFADSTVRTAICRYIRPCFSACRNG